MLPANAVRLADASSATTVTWSADRRTSAVTT
jgi:hypothetical protein